MPRQLDAYLYIFLSSECIYLYCRNRDLIGDDNPPEDRNAGQREHWTHAWMIHNLYKSKKITDSAFQSHFFKEKADNFTAEVHESSKSQEYYVKGYFSSEFIMFNLCNDWT